MIHCYASIGLGALTIAGVAELYATVARALSRWVELIEYFGDVIIHSVASVLVFT